VKRLWKRFTARQDIETELRRERPAPRQQLIDELVARIEADSSRAPRRTRPRIALVGVVGAVTLVAFGASGGLGSAKTAATDVVASTTQAVVAVVKTKPQKASSNGSKPSKNQYKEKVLVCHKGHTISVSPSAVPAHLRHGDTLGPCS
jgi:hypothetical protein